MTTTATPTIQDKIDEANPNDLPDAMRKVELGTMLTPIDTGEVTNSVVSATITLDPPALHVISCRVTDVSGGTADAGPRIMTDPSGTAAAKSTKNVGVAKLSADGATITLEGTAKKYRVVYTPRAATDPTDDFAS